MYLHLVYNVVRNNGNFAFAVTKLQSRIEMYDCLVVQKSYTSVFFS